MLPHQAREFLKRAGVTGLIVTILRSGEHVIPYGPFLSLAAFASMLFKPTVLFYIHSYEEAFRFIFGMVLG